ncbi:MAG: DNA phosphorothioation-dependent restriction protein DptG [Butyrivibrio sp.]|nr:DNA phosphorothioation-dependent restriction protein DptG [Butyrivibrio sp.]
MSYEISIERFKNGKMFDSRGKFSHKSGNKFRLFPFVTQPNSEPVLSLGNVIGTFLCMVEGKTAQKLTANGLSDMLKADFKIQPGQEERFSEVIRQLFFYSDQTIRPLNLEMLEQKVTNESSEIKIAEYLVDVLGDRNYLKKVVDDVKENIALSSNVLENLVLSKLKHEKSDLLKRELSYHRITSSLKGAFEEDFTFVLNNPKLSREYLVPLLEWYFFSYTAQASLQLNRFLQGEADSNIPLYFCLEWEKTSQSRLCFLEGWQKLQKVLEKIFAHVIVLELLNYTEPGSDLVDYIKLSELTQDSDADISISKQIDGLTDCYRRAITDCPEMKELKKKDSPFGLTDASIHYLFDSVKSQFENTGRIRPYKSYADKFTSYCHKYLKNRGRSGLMLNLTEETLIFITKLCIKNREQLRLKEVFNEFERRGIFLDNFSKDQVASYYEKLNLIEKKSDSGDAKYVKRIL